MKMESSVLERDTRDAPMGANNGFLPSANARDRPCFSTDDLSRATNVYTLTRRNVFGSLKEKLSKRK